MCLGIRPATCNITFFIILIIKTATQTITLVHRGLFLLCFLQSKTVLFKVNPQGH